MQLSLIWYGFSIKWNFYRRNPKHIKEFWRKKLICGLFSWGEWKHDKYSQHDKKLSKCGKCFPYIILSNHLWLPTSHFFCRWVEPPHRQNPDTLTSWTQVTNRIASLLLRAASQSITLVWLGIFESGYVYLIIIFLLS